MVASSKTSALPDSTFLIDYGIGVLTGTSMTACPECGRTTRYQNIGLRQGENMGVECGNPECDFRGILAWHKERSADGQFQVEMIPEDDWPQYFAGIGDPNDNGGHKKGDE